MCFFLDPSPVRRVPIQTGIQRKLNFVSVRTIKGSSSRGLLLGLLIDSKNLFIGQYDKLFEEYWLSPISYLSPYRG